MNEQIDPETGEVLYATKQVELHGAAFFRTQYNYDRDAASKATATTCEIETRTQQQFKDECDINKLMERFGVTGTVPQVIRPPMQEDYEGIFDFQTAMNTLRRAQEEFMKMPSGVRARFQNNPHIFTQYFQNPENRAEAEKLGLVLPQPKKEPIVAPEPPGGAQT